MTYLINIPNKVKKVFRKFDRSDTKQIAKAVSKLSENPFPIGCKRLVNFGFREYRIRIGDYRVLYDIDHNKKTINVLKIGHRKDIYKR